MIFESFMCEESVIISERVQKQIDYCLKMKPEDTNTSVGELQEKLDKLITRQDDTKQYKLRPNSSTNVDKKKIDSTFHELSLDLVRLNNNFECLIECVKNVLVHIDELNIIRAKIETLNDRITQLERRHTLQSTASFKGNQFHTDQSNRIDKLEYVTSERERENRLLQVVITHPCITPDSNNLTDHIRHFY